MQKLSVELKNAPRNASLVPCSASVLLNRGESLSATRKVLADNNSEENHSQRTGRSLKPFVYVLSKQGSPLMPCSQAKSKRMLKKGAASVVKRIPFTIQLKFECKNQIQPISLGIDPGYSHIGFSCVTNTKELISGTLELDNMVSKRIANRAMYRNTRRNRLWYRKPRFNNRVSSKKKGWLPPSIQHKLDAHVNLIKKIIQLLPISSVTIEVANFDIQKINNPNIKEEQYQQGNLYGYDNIKSYIIAREHGKCQLCGKEYKNGWHIHHIIPQSKGGTDKPDNLALLHKNCHDKYHKYPSKYKLKQNKQYKAETFMSTIRYKLVDMAKQIISNTNITYGYITQSNRRNQNLKKLHNNDAFIIAGGTVQQRTQAYQVYQHRINNRSLQKNRKGHKPSIRGQRYKIQPNDLVKIDGKWHVTKGMHNKGSRLMIDKKSISVKKVDSFFNSGSIVWRMAIPPSPKGKGFLAAVG